MTPFQKFITRDVINIYENCKYKINFLVYVIQMLNQLIGANGARPHVEKMDYLKEDIGAILRIHGISVTLKIKVSFNLSGFLQLFV